MRKMKINLFLIVLLTIFSFLFYIRLFLPRPSLFFTPDLGRSDVIHYFLAKRVLLSQALRDGHFPLWTSETGTGVSLIGEGQIGSYNIVNLVLFFLFPPFLAFNLSYVVYSIVAAVGMFVLARFLNFSRFVSIFVAFVFTFSGFFIFRITHISIFASAAFLPLIFLFGFKILKSRNLLDVLLLAFCVTQQIFAAHLQILFISLIGLIFLLSPLLITNKKERKKNIQGGLFVFIAICLGLLMAAVSLMPQIEFKSISVRQKGFSFGEATADSLTPKFLLTLINPFSFGNPANGTYPLLNREGGWDIFWEKMGYIGLIPLLLALAGIFANKQKSSIYRGGFVFLLFGGTLLAFGKYSPTLFLYLLPPFNFFREPGRFLLLIVFALSILAGFGLEYFWEKIASKRVNAIGLFALEIFLLLLVFIPAFSISSSYHSIVPTEQILENPPAASFLKDKPGRVYQLGGGWPYLQQLLKYGWKDISYFLFAKNSLDANINIFFGIPQVNLYDGILTQRQAMLQSLLRNEVQGDLVNFTATQSALHQKILNLTSTRFLISPFKIDNENLPLVKTINPPPTKIWPPFYIYENLKVLPRIRFVGSYKNAANPNQALELIKTGDFNPETVVVVESDLSRTFETVGLQKIKVLKDKNQEILLDVDTQNDSLLVLADSFYPGWEAYVDGKLTKIYPANINQRAVVIPAGQHTIHFLFSPKSFRVGMLISLVSFSLWGTIIIKCFFVKRKT